MHGTKFAAPRLKQECRLCLHKQGRQKSERSQMPGMTVDQLMDLAQGIKAQQIQAR